jgi:hypothetical protein
MNRVRINIEYITRYHNEPINRYQLTRVNYFQTLKGNAEINVM